MKPAAIQPIETVYKGYRFRSRLEARWAVCFDRLGIKWEYEIEGYERPGPDGRPFRYLPDFWLPDSETHVEVKGSDAALLDEVEFMKQFLAHGCPLPTFDGCDFDVNYHRARGLLLLGNIPEPVPGAWLFRIVRSIPFAKHTELTMRWAHFGIGGGCTSLNVLRESSDLLYMVTGLGVYEWSVTPCLVQTRIYLNAVLQAYQAARSARFEFGETPR